MYDITYLQPFCDSLHFPFPVFPMAGIERGSHHTFYCNYFTLLGFPSPSKNFSHKFQNYFQTGITVGYKCALVAVISVWSDIPDCMYECSC